MSKRAKTQYAPVEVSLGKDVPSHHSSIYPIHQKRWRTVVYAPVRRKRRAHQALRSNKRKEHKSKCEFFHALALSGGMIDAVLHTVRKLAALFQGQAF